MTDAPGKDALFDGESSGETITLSIVREMVQARSRRLTLRWTLEAVQDGGSHIDPRIVADLAEQLRVRDQVRNARWAIAAVRKRLAPLGLPT